MEACVRSESGLLPEHLATVRLTTLEAGRWQARCIDGAGRVRELLFEGEGAQERMNRVLRTDFGFTDYGAEETARRLFEPFEIAAGWPSPEPRQVA